nr:TALE protein [Tanacetum cinerariifolium]
MMQRGESGDEMVSSDLIMAAAALSSPNQLNNQPKNMVSGQVPNQPKNMVSGQETRGESYAVGDNAAKTESLTFIMPKSPYQPNDRNTVPYMRDDSMFSKSIMIFLDGVPSPNVSHLQQEKHYILREPVATFENSDPFEAYSQLCVRNDRARSPTDLTLFRQTTYGLG